MHGFTQSLCIHANALLVNADTQSTTYLLTLGCCTASMAQGAYLEYIRVVPSFTQCRVREDESCRFVETQQTLLVFKNQIVS